MRKKSYEYPFLWSQSSAETMTFEKAVAFCDNLDENGFDDWRLPELSEIRTLAGSCIEEENQDFCAVTDSCEWNNCESELCGKCIRYGENFDFGSFWTAVRTADGRISLWIVTPEEESADKSAVATELHKTKCVRIKQ